MGGGGGGGGGVGVPGRECLREGWGAARLVCGGVPGRECLREGWVLPDQFVGGGGGGGGVLPGRECLREGWGAAMPDQFVGGCLESCSLRGWADLGPLPRGSLA